LTARGARRLGEQESGFLLDAVARGVDEHVDAPEPLDRGRDGLLGALRVGYV
jgi:hypothetical protein